MKTSLLISTLLLLIIQIATAQDCRYETLTGTNSISIAEYETGQLISVLMTNGSLSASGFPYFVKVQKDNFTFVLKSSASFMNQAASVPNGSSGIGDTIRGPATFSLLDHESAQGFTIKITPVSFPPNQTLIVPPGTNQVQITMETSTNLVNWAAATNGVYGDPSEARFFRLHMVKLN